jgi:hypothetical protein
MLGKLREAPLLRVSVTVTWPQKSVRNQHFCAKGFCKALQPGPRRARAALAVPVAHLDDVGDASAVS